MSCGICARRDPDSYIDRHHSAEKKTFSAIEKSRYCAMFRFSICWRLSLCVFVASISAHLDARERPNIVIIMADDMGYSDAACYGGEIETPNLDKLAAEGVRFTHFYNTGRCCPTRASLLTGLYSHQAGIGHMTGNNGLPAYQGYLNNRCLTIAEALKPAGYTTMLSGKWHVGSAPENWPLKRGFDKFYGIPQGGGHYYRNLPGRQLVLGDREIPIPEDWFATEGFTEHAVQFIEEEKGSEKPFFLYVAYTAPHWPLQARQSDIEKYDGRYDLGWDVVRAARYKRMTEMGIVRHAWPLSERNPQSIPWEDETKKSMMSNRMEAYAAQVDALDQGVASILAALEKSEKRQNTVVMFLSDNGCSAEGGQKGFNNPDRGDVGAKLGTRDSYVSAGLSWANACNTPYRKHKMKVHEGGIATPLIVSWPQGMSRTKGGLEHSVGHVIDLMPTCLELGVASYESEEMTPLQGRSFVAAMKGKMDTSAERTIFWEHEGNRAVRRGKWKLVASHKGEWELYDLDSDRTEQRDQVSNHPETVSELKSLYNEWAQRCGVQPWPVRNKGN
ncbi:MAG: arylsulfatase A-like enzyme [Verrucomicrobiales bacterium]|jgi:arylsulfatase A-like enzyme